MPLALAVHGGAYSIPDDLVAAHEKGCSRALLEGWRVLSAGGSSLDAVEAAVRILEDDPVFDAATGGHLNRDGVVECDAAIMDGHDLRAGAVAALTSIRNPVSVARRLLESETAVFLAGAGALRFAIDRGIEPVPPESLVVPRERARFEERRRTPRETAGTVFGGDSSAALGTVGAVAIDRAGHVAAATSTAGTPFKHAGRVGDAPLIGCGTYADDAAGAISCTGWGESIIRVALARRAAEQMERGETAAAAAQRAIEVLASRVSGLGGMIVVAARPRDGESPLGVAFNTSHMARALIIEGRDPVVSVHPG